MNLNTWPVVVFTAAFICVAGAVPWEDATVFEINRLPMRAATTPGDTINLCGEWDFEFYASPADNSPAKRGKITVPGCWELQGYGRPLYVNSRYPFKVDPPRVMGEPSKDFTTYLERNPTGIYRRSFTLDAQALKRRVIITFKGVSSAYFVRVNGQEIGYAEDSRLPSEFDITAAVKPGENQLEVKVFKYSDGSYLEDDDFWRLSGLFRDVSLCLLPSPAIWDVQHGVVLHKDLKSADITPTVTLYAPDNIKELRPEQLSATLHDAAGKEVCTTQGKTVSGAGRFVTITCAPVHITNPHLWYSEDPYLYTLHIRLNNEDTRRISVGFRRGAFDGLDFTINGRKIKIKGVNRHEMSPDQGYTQTEELIEKDLHLIKAANFNFIRTAHYPNDDRFYALCNKLGLYVMDEANIESHGLSYHKRVLPGDLPEWVDATLARGERMVIRNRNNPCVLMWSLGNEAGYGSTFLKLREKMRAADPEKRPIQYADMNLAADMDSQTYPTPDWLKEHLQGKAQRKGERNEISRKEQHGDYPSNKPFLMNEYSHAMGNSLGNFKEYWDLIDANPMLIGGFIWDWVDQGLWKTLPDGQRMLAYGGDFGDSPTDFNFCINGLVSPLREPHPHYFEAQKIQQPIKIEQIQGKPFGTLRLSNRHEIINANTYRVFWMVEGGGMEFERGECVVDIEPGTSKEVSLPIKKEGPLLMILFRKGDSIIAWEQIANPDPAIAKKIAPMPAKALNKIEPQFDSKTGYLISLKSDGKELLHAPLMPNFWRAPTDNDIGAKNHTKSALWKDVMAKAKLAVFEKNGNVVHAEYALPQETKLIVDYRCEATAITVSSKLIFADKNTLPHVPKIGYQVVLAGNYDQIQYYGKGPHENYWDRQESAAISTFSMRSLQTDNYVRPQENGNRCNVHWMVFNQQKLSVSIQAEKQPLMMSAWQYLQQDLETAKHAIELKSRNDLLTVNIDHLQMGVGGDNSWGLPVHPEYTIPPKGTYTWTFTVAVTGQE
jgi:beta-galactosidase